MVFKNAVRNVGMYLRTMTGRGCSPYPILTPLQTPFANYALQHVSLKAVLYGNWNVSVHLLLLPEAS